MLSEVQIKSALKKVPTSGKKSILLTDDIGDRGAGRLTLLVRPFPDRVVAEWYGWYGNGGDIHDRKQAEEVLRHALADLARVNR